MKNVIFILASFVFANIALASNVTVSCSVENFTERTDTTSTIEKQMPGDQIAGALNLGKFSDFAVTAWLASDEKGSRVSEVCAHLKQADICSESILSIHVNEFDGVILKCSVK